LEQSNECDIDSCTIELNFKDMDLDNEYKKYRHDIKKYLTKKEAYKNKKGIPNTIEFSGFSWSGQILTLEIDIKPATQNYFGIETIYNSSWANSSYDNKFQVNLSSSILTDQYALVNLSIPTNTDSFRDDCSDIRVYNCSEDGQLDWDWDNYDSGKYGCNEADTIIWVRTLVKADNTSCFFVYYNNPNETAFFNTTSTYQDYFVDANINNTWTYNVPLNNNPHTTFWYFKEKTKKHQWRSTAIAILVKQNRLFLKIAAENM